MKKILNKEVDTKTAVAIVFGLYTIIIIISSL